MTAYSGFVRQRWATVAVVVVAAATVALIIRQPIKEPGLAHRLIAMQRAIDKNNVNFFGGGRPSIGDLSEAMRNRLRDAAEVDDDNTAELSEIIERHGWPTENEVGGEALLAAMNVVGRSRDVNFQARAIDLMDKAGVERNEQYARLVDLVAAQRGEPQTYGTQWTCSEDGRVTLTTPVKDAKRLQQLRAEVGLPRFDTFASQFCGEPPRSTDSYIIESRVP